MEYMFPRGDLSLFHRFVGDLENVITDGFGKAGGMNCNNIRVIGGENIVNGLDQVGLSAENRGAFGKGTGGGHDGLPVVAGQGAPVIGAAPLRSVAVGQAIMNP